MHLNPTKCNFMTVCFQQPPVKPPFDIDNFRINQNTCLKLLGVCVQENLKWDTQIDFMCKSFNHKLYFLRQLKRCTVSVCSLRLVYILYIRPVIEYAAPVWFSGLTKKQLECLERLQKRALRMILSYDYCMNCSFFSFHFTLFPHTTI